MISQCEEVEFFDVHSFSVKIRCSVLFDVVSYSTFSNSTFSHSLLGPYSTLCPIRRSIIRCSVIRCWVFRRSVIRCSVIRRSVFRRSVGESLLSLPPSSHVLWPLGFSCKEPCPLPHNLYALAVGAFLRIWTTDLCSQAFCPLPSIPSRSPGRV